MPTLIRNSKNKVNGIKRKHNVKLNRNNKQKTRSKPRQNGNNYNHSYPIEFNIMNSVLCSNINRVGILHLLRNVPRNELQAERIAYALGISHRTALYHLEILKQCGFIEVRKFRKKGLRMLRSVWGLKITNGDLDVLFGKIYENFDIQKLDKAISKNIVPR